MGVGAATNSLDCSLDAGGLRLIGNEINSRLSSRELLRHRSFAPVFAIGATALSVTLLHAIEAVMWAKRFFDYLLVDYKGLEFYHRH